MKVDINKLPKCFSCEFWELVEDDMGTCNKLAPEDYSKRDMDLPIMIDSLEGPIFVNKSFGCIFHSELKKLREKDATKER